MLRYPTKINRGQCLVAAEVGRPKSYAIRAFPSHAYEHLPNGDVVAVVAAAVGEVAVAVRD